MKRSTKKNGRVQKASAPTSIQRVILKSKFLEILRDGRTVIDAVGKIGISTHTPYDWRDQDQDFALEWNRAVIRGREVRIERFRQEAVRRAMEGDLKPVYQGGERVGEIRERSDSLLMFLMKRDDPEYRDGPKTVLAPQPAPSGEAATQIPPDPDEAIRRLEDAQERCKRLIDTIRRGQEAHGQTQEGTGEHGASSH